MSYFVRTLFSAALLSASALASASVHSAHIGFDITYENGVTAGATTYYGGGNAQDASSDVVNGQYAAYGGDGSSSTRVETLSSSGVHTDIDAISYGNASSAAGGSLFIQAFTVGTAGGWVDFSYQQSIYSDAKTWPTGNQFVDTDLHFDIQAAGSSESTGYLFEPSIPLLSDPPAGQTLSDSNSFRYFIAGNDAPTTYYVYINAILNASEYTYDTNPPTGPTDPLPVPEPETWALMGIGAVALVVRGRKRSQ